ncbi:MULTISPECIES: YciI family protein [unclassified Streptomyces]|uniref:YciI family protein n=1 Tax=unclassified Streptomyces TaxID=2593676 RepID=UPI00225B847A|nr:MULTISPECIES: YciI family protein [unclassified Streptomyces]MCX5144355.1 YciI family protein [Streptomyces sp. NBC_00338]
MFVLDLSYTAPLDRVDAVMKDHVAWLDGQYAAGVIIASGRKNPREGGVILAVGDDRAAITRLTESDPFVVAGVCAYRVTEFIATKTSDALAPYRQQP